MKRHEIIDHLEQLQDKVDKMGFKGQNEYDLHLREEIADWLLSLFAVSGQSEQLINFLLHLNDKKLINNHDFDYEKEAKKYLKKIN